MKTPIRHHVVCCIALLLPVVAPIYISATEADSGSARVSLLTCAPGEEIYSLFGHTGIRYEDPEKRIDIVFNYGIFSFETPNFVWRFVKGETDYMLGATDFRNFKIEYTLDNRAVWQQTLNLTGAEKENLIRLLQINYHPGNRVYRYNFFFDNCATRPRDKIEESISGRVSYADTTAHLTFRNMVHAATTAHPWERFGMDFCLGVKADRPATYRERMFAPLYLMEAFAHAVVIDSTGHQRPLVSETQEIVTPQPVEKDTHTAGTLVTPLRAALLLFALTALITIYGLRKRRALWRVDILLFGVAGLAGCVIAFLSCFSTHPAVSPNYLIFVFHPLHLLLLPFFVRRQAKGLRSYYHAVNTVVLTLFILIWPFNPQYFDPAILPLALCLLIRSVNNLVLTYNKKQ